MNAHSAELTPPELLMHRVHENFSGEMIVVGVARFAGSFQPEAVTRALATLQQRHPALRAVIHEEGRSAWFAEPDELQPIPVTWRETDDLSQGGRVALGMATQPFAVRRGPLMRLAFHFSPRQQLTDVFIITHHTVSDGRSLITFLKELVLLCGGETLPAAISPDVRPYPQIPTQAGILRPIWQEIRQRIRQRRTLRASPLRDFTRLPYVPQVFERQVWSAAGTASLRDRARLEKTTVFGALSAACLRALVNQHQLQNCSGRIRSPLDFRSLCEPPISREPLGCYIAMMQFVILQIDRTPFWDLARQAVSEVQRTLTTGLWAASIPLLKMLLRRGRIPKSQPILMNMNNLGVVEEIASGTSKLVEFGWTANQVNKEQILMFAAATVAGRLNLSIHTPFHSTDEVTQLFEHVWEQLDQAVA